MCPHWNKINDSSSSPLCRQACAIESAAKWNSNRDIFIIFAAQVGFNAKKSYSPVINALKTYPNVHFRTVDWYKYAIGTPAEQWIKKDIIFKSKYFNVHLSDLLRLVTLYKFGGVYFDLDFVIQSNLDNLSPNFAGAQIENDINNAVFGFERNGVGHKLIDMILRCGFFFFFFQISID